MWLIKPLLTGCFGPALLDNWFRLASNCFEPYERVLNTSLERPGHVINAAPIAPGARGSCCKLIINVVGHLHTKHRTDAIERIRSGDLVYFSGQFLKEQASRLTMRFSSSTEVGVFKTVV